MITSPAALPILPLLYRPVLVARSRRIVPVSSVDSIQDLVDPPLEE